MPIGRLKPVTNFKQPTTLRYLLRWRGNLCDSNLTHMTLMVMRFCDNSFTGVGCTRNLLRYRILHRNWNKRALALDIFGYLTQTTPFFLWQNGTTYRLDTLRLWGCFPIRIQVVCGWVEGKIYLRVCRALFDWQQTSRFGDYLLIVVEATVGLVEDKVGFFLCFRLDNLWAAYFKIEKNVSSEQFCWFL